MTSLRSIFAGLALLLFLAPAFASAAPFEPFFGKPILSCTANYTQDVIRDGSSTPKCASLCDLLATGQNLVNWIMTMSLYVVAPVAFVAGAAMIMMGGANPGLLSQGKRMIFGTALALAMVLGSYVIVSTIFFLIPNIHPNTQPTTWGTITCDPTKAPGGQLDVRRFQVCSQCTAEQLCVEKPLGQGTDWVCETRTTCGGQTQGTCPSGQTCRRVSGQYICQRANSGTNNSNFNLSNDGLGPRASAEGSQCQDETGALRCFSSSDCDGGSSCAGICSQGCASRIEQPTSTTQFAGCKDKTSPANPVICSRYSASRSNEANAASTCFDIASKCVAGSCLQTYLECKK